MTKYRRHRLTAHRKFSQGLSYTPPPPISEGERRAGMIRGFLRIGRMVLFSKIFNGKG